MVGIYYFQLWANQAYNPRKLWACIRIVHLYLCTRICISQLDNRMKKLGFSGSPLLIDMIHVCINKRWINCRQIAKSPLFCHYSFCHFLGGSMTYCRFDSEITAIQCRYHLKLHTGSRSMPIDRLTRVWRIISNTRIPFHLILTQNEKRVLNQTVICHLCHFGTPASPAMEDSVSCSAVSRWLSEDAWGGK